LTFATEGELITNRPWWEIGYDTGHHLAFPHPLQGNSNTGHDWSMGMEDDETALYRFLTTYQPAWNYNEAAPPE
jgi:hypothetical protein